MKLKNHVNHIRHNGTVMLDIFLFDMYLTHLAVVIIVRFIVIAAILLNVVGLILKTVEYRKRRKWLSGAIGLTLHMIPLIVFGSYFYWLAFGHWL